MCRRGFTAKRENMSSSETTITAPGTTNQPKSKRAKKANTKVASKKETTKKQAKAKKAATTKEKPAAREGSKKAIILELLRRKEGATIAEVVKATQWQNHSIRGFISGTITKKMGLTVESVKSDTGDRTYRIA